jgi:hypothetical protein
MSEFALRDFITALADLTREHGFTISGPVDWEGNEVYPEVWGHGIRHQLVYTDNGDIYATY